MTEERSKVAIVTIPLPPKQVLYHSLSASGMLQKLHTQKV